MSYVIIKRGTMTTMIGVCLVCSATAAWTIRDKKINQEIDEFDRSMRKLKANVRKEYSYYQQEACERKEVTKCCQIK